jgi:two-component system response regulator FixJ
MVHIVEDDEAVRDSLAMMLDHRGFRTEGYGSAEEFLARLPAAPDGCAVVDVRMPGMDGLELQRELARRRVGLPIVIVTGHADVPLAVASMKAGAVDFLEKPYTLERMLEAIEAALRAVTPGRVDPAAAEAVATLSPRERQVLEGLLAGHQNKAIAGALRLSPRTVEVYRANMMEKLRVHTLSQALRVALAAGLDGGAAEGDDPGQGPAEERAARGSGGPDRERP